MVDHPPSLGLGLFDVDCPRRPVGCRLVSGDAVYAHLGAAVGVCLAGDDLGGLDGIDRPAFPQDTRFRGRCALGPVVLRRLGDRAEPCRRQSAPSVQHPFNGVLRFSGRSLVLLERNAPALAAGDSDDSALHLRGLGDVEVKQVLEVVFDALVVGAEGKEYLAELLPAFVGAADAEPLLGVCVRGDEDGADDVAQLLAGSGAHGAAYSLDNVDGALARFEEGDGAERRGVGPLAEDADVEDAVRSCVSGLGEAALGVVASHDVAGGVEVLERVVGGDVPLAVFAHPLLQPVPHRVGFEVARHVPGLVDRVHEGDAGLDGHCVLVAALGGSAHSEREGEPPQVVRGGQGLTALALGVQREQVGGLVCVGVVHAEGDDAVVGEPFVLDGLHIALAVELDAEGCFVVHRADDPIGGLVPVHLGRVVDARGGGLVDAIGCGEGVVVVAEGEVAEALFVGRERDVLGVLLPAQSGGAVGFVGDEDASGSGSLPQGLGNAMAALVRAEDDVELKAALTLAYPVGDFRRVGGHLALHFGGADVAVVDGGVVDDASGALLRGVVAGGFVGADGEGPDGCFGVLEEFAPDLGDEGYGWAEDDGELPLRGKLLDDAERDSGLACPARKDELAAGLTRGEAAAVGLFVLPEDADALGDGLVLHAGAGLPTRLMVRVGLAVWAFLGREGAELLHEVVVDIHHLDGLRLRHGSHRVVAQWGVAVRDNPALSP